MPNVLRHSAIKNALSVHLSYQLGNYGTQGWQMIEVSLNNSFILADNEDICLYPF